MERKTSSGSDQEESLRRILAGRCRIAGGAQPGFSMRRAALAAQAAGEDPDLEAVTKRVLDDLVESGRLLSNEAADRVYLSDSGVAWVNGDAGSADP